MNKISIAIIDSGINKCYNEFKDASIIECTMETNDEIGHGTAVASIIHKFVPDANLFIFKLFYEDRELTPKELISVLNEIYVKYDVNIIHLSSGIVFCDCLSELYNVCEKFKKKNVIIVSSFDNEGRISYPAAFDNVIGVDWSEQCSNGMNYIYLNNSPVNILGVGSLQKLPWKENEYRYVAGSSFAAPYITAVVAKCIINNINEFDMVLSYLKENAVKVYNTKAPVECINELNIKKAIVYPFNKEIHSLFKFIDLVPFEICGIYESPILRHNGLKTGDLLNNDTEYIIKSDKLIDWNSDFDTLILGHTGKISAVLNRDIIREMLTKCLDYKKNVYSFDNLDKYKDLTSKFENNSLCCKFPFIAKQNVPENQLGKLYGISAPVLCVCGTSSKQGKNTLQLELRRAFQNIGYNTGALGTEPSALLTGADEVFPMGYESNVMISGQDAVLTVNYLMHKIDMKNKDIIFIGSQSQTIPYNMGNIGVYPLAQHEFMLGTEPDAVILSINPYDECEYINNTINYLEGYIQTKVIALSLFPIKRRLDWTVAGADDYKLEDKELKER